MGKILRQVQKVQAQILKLQEELEGKTVSVSAGGGMVTATVNGKLELVGLEIKPEAVNAEEVELLQDLVVAAVNGALRKAQEMISSEMAKATGGLKIPGLS